MNPGRKRPDATGEKRIMVALKMLPEEHAEIQKRARKLRMTKTDYMIRACLGQPLDNASVENRLLALEERMDRLEQFSDLGDQ